MNFADHAKTIVVALSRKDIVVADTWHILDPKSEKTVTGLLLSRTRESGCQ
jgi:hypothetical protein